jgi:hypothetical protein
MGILTVTEPVSFGFGFHCFDINGGEKVSKERHMLLHIGPHLVDQQCHLYHQLRIRGIGDIGFLDSGIHIHLRGVRKAERRGPHDNLMSDLPLRLRREA